MAAALAHMTGQFWLAYLWFVPHSGLLTLYPVLMSLAAILGVLSGWLTRTVLAQEQQIRQQTDRIERLEKHIRSLQSGEAVAGVDEKPRHY